MIGLRPYFIDHWNPYGESSILVKMSLESYTSKTFYLYYGYDKDLIPGVHGHGMHEIATFFDDFNDSEILDYQWNIDHLTTGGIEVEEVVGEVSGPLAEVKWYGVKETKEWAQFEPVVGGGWPPGPGGPMLGDPDVEEMEDSFSGDPALPNLSLIHI